MKNPRCAVAPAKANETKTSQEIAEKWSKMAQNDAKQVAQGQYVVSDTRCPALLDWELQ